MQFFEVFKGLTLNMNLTKHLTDLNFKPKGYFSWTRQEMIDFVPKFAKRILDVGCGDGSFSSILKSKLNAEVWGVEINARLSHSTRCAFDKLIIGDIVQKIDELPLAFFDCVIFNDVLEHLADPFEVLNKTKNLLTKRGTVVSSIPNVRYCLVLKDLLINKQWSYTDGGVLDKTHLRFFTQKSILGIFEVLGYEVLSIKGINKRSSWKFILFNIMTLGFFSDSQYQQFACVAKLKAK